MTSPVTEFFTRRFLMLYGAPNTIDQKAFASEYEKALGGTDPRFLEEASNLLVKQHKYRNWPTVGECVEAVNIVATRRNRERELRQHTNPAYRKEPTVEEKARVKDLVRHAGRALQAAAPPRLPAKPLPRTDRIAWEAWLQSSDTARWCSSWELRDLIAEQTGGGMRRRPTR